MNTMVLVLVIYSEQSLSWYSLSHSLRGNKNLLTNCLRQSNEFEEKQQQPSSFKYPAINPKGYFSILK